VLVDFCSDLINLAHAIHISHQHRLSFQAVVGLPGLGLILDPKPNFGSLLALSVLPTVETECPICYERYADSVQEINYCKLSRIFVAAWPLVVPDAPFRLSCTHIFGRHCLLTYVGRELGGAKLKILRCPLWPVSTA
jgi:hypothetical protein